MMQQNESITGIQAPRGAMRTPAAVRPGGPAGAAVSTLNVKDVLGILQRRVWLILILTVLFTAGGIGLYFLLLKQSPKYTSRGIIRVKMPSRANILSPNSLLPRSDIIEIEAQSKATYLRNEAFLAKALTRQAIRETSWYQKRADNQEDLQEDLQDDFSASPQRNSDYVLVSFSANSPAESQIILREILLEFEQQMKDQAEGSLRNTLRQLRDERRSQEAQLTLLRDRQATLNRQANMPGLEQGRQVVTDEMRLLNQEQLRLSYQQLALNQEIEQLKQGASPLVAQAIEQDPLINNLRYRVANLRETRDRLLGRFGESHRDVQEVTASIQSLQEQLDARQGQLQEQAISAQQQSLQEQQISLQSNMDQVKEQLAAVAVRQREMDNQMREYQAIQDEIDFMGRRLDRWDEQISLTQVSLNDPDLIPAEVVVRANKPLMISFPKLPMFLAGGIVLGLMVSVGLAFLLEFADDSIKSPGDVMRYLRAPNLGMIPLYEEEDADTIEVSRICAIHPQSMISESFRQMKTDIMFSSPEGELKTLLVTSSSAGCGRTVTAVNLAITFAAEGKRVLLVDGNFRRPAIHRLFASVGERMGLSNVLVGQASAEKAIHATDINNLDVLESGPLPPSPAHLLGSRQMREFVDQQRRRYDFVIIDGPPALVVNDARTLATLADGTLVVVRAEKTSRGIVQRLLRELSIPNVRILGVVVNAVRPRRGGYYQKTYRSYYDYVESRPAAAAPLQETT
ncbi:MAG: polysaccharide biosynthesis tyrosine autokinase [Sedimentisphaerales bacterium]|nr:polysaccharide biosynthesis tyrosine autokinase [Sedimentisphaerales bacterium]